MVHLAECCAGTDLLTQLSEGYVDMSWVSPVPCRYGFPIVIPADYHRPGLYHLHATLSDSAWGVVHAHVAESLDSFGSADNCSEYTAGSMPPLEEPEESIYCTTTQSTLTVDIEEVD